MRRPLLRNLVIENYRSINKRIEVRLDAPVVLVHGQNGQGKTTILSAVELALTKQLSALERVDPHYETQLLHYGTKKGRIALEVEFAPEDRRTIDVEIGKTGVFVRNEVDVDLSKFFAERCYLAQSLLNQLLTIYQTADAGVHSPLSRFVHELLGLDRLDAIELGLSSARDLRNARRLSPAYETVEYEKNAAQKKIEALREQVGTDQAGLREVEAVARTHGAALGAEIPGTIEQLQQLIERLQGAEEENELALIADRRRRLHALRLEYERLQQNSPVSQVAESRHSIALSAFNAWREENLSKIVEFLDAAWEMFPDVDRQDFGSDFESALQDILTRSGSENERLSAILERERQRRERLEALSRETSILEKTLSDLNGQISSLSAEAGALSAALAELVPLVHDENCPACGRDFSEESSGSLSHFIATRAASLSDQAARLTSLTTEQRRVSAKLDQNRAEWTRLTVGTPSEAQSLEIAARHARLAVLLDDSNPLIPIAAEGTKLARDEAIWRRSITRSQARQQGEETLRVAVAQLGAEIGEPPSSGTEPIVTLLEGSTNRLTRDETQTKTRMARKAELIKALDSIRQRREAVARSRAQIDELTESLREWSSRFRAAEAVRKHVRTTLGVLADTRATVVGRVFNERLNRIWRDLFVRLAPSESFVPAFKVPREAHLLRLPILETVHRSGETGGTPGAMLSAGNLNTAALTLFLALHLSVKPKLPWLLLDDPVQSMDDVHIAQFAALLRTLAREHDRQVIMAVHDKQLFDYLALELSPAFAGDELITVEIGKSATRESRVLNDRLYFKPETAVQPAA